MLRGGPGETGGKLETGKFCQNVILQTPEQTKKPKRLKGATVQDKVMEEQRSTPSVANRSFGI